MSYLQKRAKLVREVIFFVVGVIIGLLLLAISLWFITRETIFPNIMIANIAVGGMDQTRAQDKLAQAKNSYFLEVKFNGSSWQLPPETYQIDYGDSISRALRVGRTFDPTILSELIRREVNIPLTVYLEEDKLASWSANISESVAIVAQPAKLAYSKNNIAFTNGEDGIEVDDEVLRQLIIERLSMLNATPVEIPTTTKKAALNDIERGNLLTRAHQLLGDSLTIEIEDEKVSLGTSMLIGFLSVEPDQVGQINELTATQYVAGLKERYNREPQDAKFEFAEGKVHEFAPGRDGIEINEPEMVRLLVTTLTKLTLAEEKESIEAPLIRKAPKIATSEVNNLGIVERIGRGESYYAHSIANRIYNVGLASTRVNGALVAPGEEFSFNKFVGEISGATGYKTAYVISGGRTVLGDGGGVCQVSTTLFRAVMNAGLPITERWGHAYRVGYYEQNSDPGIDATVYSPSKDFKFVNDTPRHILVQAINDPKNLHLIFEIYGTRDGRVASVSKPKVWGVTPPPPDLYEDDPNLPAGTVKQVDWAAWGAKTSFDYKVERDGQTIFEKTYTTNYRPWQNVYIRGTMGAVTQ